jgi:cellulose synthase operon protein C
MATDFEALVDQIKRVYEQAVAIEPAEERFVRAELTQLVAAVTALAAAAPAGLAAAPADERAELEHTLAIVYARAAAVAIAARSELEARRWLEDAARLAAPDSDLRAELGAARLHPERYRQLVYGRCRMANGGERDAVAAWKALAKDGTGDAITEAATAQLAAPRPLKPGRLPSLYRLNGFGVSFYGRRAEEPDGSYVTTHCVSALFVPLIPIGAYRVRDADGGYSILAREQLSKFARVARLAVPVAIAAAIAVAAVHNHLTDPTRLARLRFDDAIEHAAATTDREAALGELDAALGTGDAWRLDPERTERAGAAIVARTAGYAPTPFTPASVDQARRLTARYAALPASAQGGVARAAVVETLDRWIADLGATPATAEARLALLEQELDVVEVARRSEIAPRIARVVLEVAGAQAADWPLDALALLVDHPGPETIARADDIVSTLGAQPSLLLDAGADLDGWIAASTKANLVAATRTARGRAEAVRADDERETIPAAELAAMAKQRPWDQLVALRRARNLADADPGAALAALEAIGSPGRTIREAALFRAQLLAATGKLAEADALLAGLLGARLRRFTAASAKLASAMASAEALVKRKLETNEVPAALEQAYRAQTDDEGRERVVREWGMKTISEDGAVVAAQARYFAVSDVVPISLAAGTVKLRRAQAMPDGPARTELLRAAEQTFLAIRDAAEGQPAFRLGLGEIYARLGKTAESNAEFQALLAKGDPDLSLAVAETYRTIGQREQARAVALKEFERPGATTEQRSGAAILLAQLSRSGLSDEEESWLRKADQSNSFVRTSLLEVEARRLERQGKRSECAAKFAEVAAAHRATARPGNSTGYNNAALAHHGRFGCSGDPQALVEAEAMFEQAYRAGRDNAIVVGNFVDLLDYVGRVRVLGKHLDLTVFPPRKDDVDALLGALVDGPERAAILAELAAEPRVRRAEAIAADYEVLAPNAADPLAFHFSRALERRDEAAAAAVVARATRAKLDRSEVQQSRAKWRDGSSDAALDERIAGNVARLAPIAGSAKLDPRTRAAALFVMASNLRYGGVRGDLAMLQRSREALAQAMKLWPALDSASLQASLLVDEAAIAAGGGAAWTTLRRELSPAEALAKLAADRAPLVAAVKQTPLWAQVAPALRANVRPPTLDGLRLAQLVGDADLEARYRAALDDKLVQLAVELELVFDPDGASAKGDAALLKSGARSR